MNPYPLRGNRMTDLIDVEGAALDPEVAQRAADGVMAAQAKALSKALADGARAFIFPYDAGGKLNLLLSEPADCVVLTVMDASTPTGRRETMRKNDVFLEITNGVATIRPNDPYRELKLKWCESHPKRCREYNAPEADTWAKMIDAQLNKANREPSLDPSLDVDAIIAGDFSGLGKADSLVGRASILLEQSK